MKRLRPLTLLAILLLAPRCAWGQWRDFRPKIGGYTGELELNGMYDSSTSESPNNTTENTDIVFRERLNLTMYGYLYHPRFVSYRVRGAAGMEEFSSENQAGSRSGAATSSDYDIRAIALPKHPYNLEIFTSRNEPLLTGISVGDKPVRYQHGSYLRYKKRPWQASLGYVFDTISQENDSSDTQTLRLAANYFIRHFQVAGSFQHADNQQPLEKDKTRDSLFVDSEATYKNMTLLSDFSLSQEEETGREISFTQLQRLTWREQLAVDLPWNLDASLSYQLNNDRNVIRAAAGVAETETFAEGQSYGFSLQHRLYESLTTGVSTSLGKTQSSGGENQQASYRLHADYRKNIHRGKISTSVWTRYATLDRSGAPTVLDEIHDNIGELDGFVLFNPRIDRATIVLRVRDDLGVVRDFEGQFLVSGTGDTTEITILTFAPTPNLNPASTPTFVVSYSFISGEYAIYTRNNGFSVRLSLLDNLVQPYYSHGTTSQGLISGIYPGNLSYSTSDTLGLAMQKTPFSVGVEYQKVQSEVNPATSWRVRGNYFKYFSEYTKLFLDVEGEQETSHQFQNGLIAEEVTEKGFSSDLRLQQRIPRRHMVLSMGGRFMWRTGITQTTVYSANSHLTWHVGRMDLNFGASYSSATTEFGDSTLHSRNILVYTNLKRKLF